MINDINENILNDCIENGYSLYRVETDHLICKNKFSTEEIQKYTSEGNFEIIYAAQKYNYSIFSIENQYVICHNKFIQEEIDSYKSQGDFEIIHSPDFV